MLTHSLRQVANCSGDGKERINDIRILTISICLVR